MENLEKLKKEREELDKTIETLEYAERILEEGDEVYYIDQFGNVACRKWCNAAWLVAAFSQGHIFRTEQEAETEAKRRNLLTRFSVFRDECNGDWKADWTNFFESKHYLEIIDSKVVLDSVSYANRIATFGYFKNEEDAERAIELFGDEIKTLFVDCEG